ncbi:LacI family DNA-binding transcriptional regulator [Microbacterium sp. TPD7012]|uniref:LacI family DNA-binding transcriptional regulator n=1 Tax=Microbacterium sp. TPD7012 TaxID=2171975 RepID=UPI000D51AA42|nr:LacI family DNA-binding transcriptional regulator [Microbacterium sp. TPD7012]PVE98169.1 LacI family transcriptional regulator [Microbacterium sp. TPD7012]
MSGNDHLHAAVSPDFSDIPAELSARIERRGASTIYDVAALAGVNPSTVSRALTKPGRISQKTETRIRAAADRLDFQFNPMARALPTGRSHTIGVLVADITNPVIFGIIRGAEQAASEAAYTLVIAESQESEAAEIETIRRLLPSVDGLILATTRLPDAAISDIAARRPVVVLNRSVEGVASVLPDVRKGVSELFDHLVALGHSSIAYVAGPATSWISQQRWNELVARAVDAGVSAVEIGPNRPTIEGGISAFDRVSAAQPTAVVAFNDLLAIGLMQAAASRGVRVPEGITVAGFDDIFGSELIVPALTTVRSQLPTAGARAVGHLLAELGVDGAQSQIDQLLDTSLVIRGSSGRRLGPA